MKPLIIKKRWFALSTGLFGGAFAAAGLVTIYAYFFLDMTGDRWVALLIGPLFTAVGLTIMGFIETIGLDRQAGTITKAWGIFFPFRKKVYSLYDFSEVYTNKEVRTRNSKNGTTKYTVYPVRLRGRETLDLQEPTDFQVSRVSAEDIARYLHLPLIREMDGEVFRREANELDLSLARRRRKQGEYTSMPAVPVNTDIRMSSQGGLYRFELRADRSGFVKAVVVMVFGIPFFVFAGWFLGIFTEDEYDWFGYGFLLLFLAPIVSIIISQVIKAMLRPTLLLSPSELSLEKKLLFFTRRQSVKKDEIEELYLKGRHITVVSDKQIMVIPVLSRQHDDINFIYDMILYRLGR